MIADFRPGSNKRSIEREERVRGHVVADSEERRARWAGRDETEQRVSVVNGGAI